MMPHVGNGAAQYEPASLTTRAAQGTSGLLQNSFQQSVGQKGQPWTEEEHVAFLKGLQKLGKGNWRAIAKYYVPSRTPTQVASHAQKHFLRLQGVTKRKSRFTALEQQVLGTAASKPAAKPTTAAAQHTPATTTVPNPGNSVPSMMAMPMPYMFPSMMCNFLPAPSLVPFMYPQQAMAAAMGSLPNPAMMSLVNPLALSMVNSMNANLMQAMLAHSAAMAASGSQPHAQAAAIGAQDLSQVALVAPQPAANLNSSSALPCSQNYDYANTLTQQVLKDGDGSHFHELEGEDDHEEDHAHFSDLFFNFAGQ